MPCNLLNAGCGLVGVAVFELGEQVGEVFLRLGGLFGRGYGRGLDCGRDRRGGGTGFGRRGSFAVTVSGVSEVG